ncbi:MAG: hypothetical protein D6818_09580 [Bacteroidetes bacterium]|nr:MAG: hypothetical protein D6818_09580 [Bacteroidota bacterium]
MISEEDKELLEQWADGRMSDEERAAFEARFAGEPPLAEAARLRQEMNRYLQRRGSREELKARLAAARTAHERGRRARQLRVVWRRRLGALAAVAAVALVVVWWVGRPDLVEQYATYPPLSLTQRSGEVEALALQAERLFAERQYTEAARLLDSLHRMNPTDTLALLYEGIAWFEAGAYREAASLLESFPQGGNWTTEAWYFAGLAHLALGEKDRARELLERIPPRSGRYAQARELLERL